MTKNCPTPHDHFVRSAMVDIRISKDFLKQHLPESIKKIIDLDSLKPQKETFITDDLKEHIADMLYAVNFSGEEGYLYILVEHESSIETMMPWRLLKYMISIMDNHLKKTGEKQLPIVYPILFYSGNKKPPSY
ncbi:unnamed protein product [marine sediment metagenome]|uniref:Transposase (putative) YhgA-like domain-containing protein n=1 Tax=marine sediment metagenome TaxID=412755 RepID=X1DNA0_9ZZZZ